MKSKVVSLKEAIQEIKDGDCIFFGGIVEDRRPIAAVCEMIRQQKKNLILLGTCSIPGDLLAGANCLGAYRGCYSSNGAFGISPNLKRLSESGRIVVDDIGHLDLSLGLMAAMAGAPFIATKTCIGTDVLNPEYDNLDKARAIARDAKILPEKKYQLMEDPFFDMGLVQLHPAIHCDVCVCHVQQVGEEGTVRIDGSLTFDHYAVHAAKKVIVTAEQVVPEEYLRRDPNRNQIPCTSVDMIVEVPWGGHPGQVYNFYDMDIPFLKEYAQECVSAEGFAKWADKWIFDAKDHDGYLERLGATRLEKLRSIPPYGYRPRRQGGI